MVNLSVIIYGQGGWCYLFLVKVGYAIALAEPCPLGYTHPTVLGNLYFGVT
ncbi:MAG: hypothetical protein NWQ28_02395 [Nodularia sp. (in: cyanobacteria)]|nr:hypothetical protein [Nodularia sp. (in: cyanobacteria)]